MRQDLAQKKTQHLVANSCPDIWSGIGGSQRFRVAEVNTGSCCISQRWGQNERESNVRFSESNRGCCGLVTGNGSDVFLRRLDRKRRC